MPDTIDLLREMFPGKLTLTAEDVAQVLGRSGDKAGRASVIAGINRGDILPGLRKVGGRWLVPLRALAEWLDSLTTPATPEATAEAPERYRQRTAYRDLITEKARRCETSHWLSI